MPPWDSHVVEKKQLMAKLEAVEKRYEFYTGLYRQYSFDLLRVCIYVRKLTANERLLAHLGPPGPEILARSDRVLFETQDVSETAPWKEAAPDPAGA